MNAVFIPDLPDHQYVDMRGYQHADTSPLPTPGDLHRLISALEGVCRRGIDERLGVFGTSLVQSQALQVISSHPGLTQRHLARWMDQSAQAFGTLLRRMVVLGYLTGRRRSRGGAATHELTTLGRIMLQDTKDIAHEVLALLFQPLTDEERRSLAALLQKVLNARWRLRFLPLPESPW